MGTPKIHLERILLNFESHPIVYCLGRMNKVINKRSHLFNTQGVKWKHFSTALQIAYMFPSQMNTSAINIYLSGVDNVFSYLSILH